MDRVITRVVGVVGLLVLGAALSGYQSTANAQTVGAPSDEIANHRDRTERKVRVVLPSPYQQTDISPKPSKAIPPAASTPPVVAKPAIPAERPDSKALTFGQPIQTSTFTAPATPQDGRAFREPLKQVNRPTEDWKAGEHDLNVASLADLNSLKGGGMIGRAIIAGRPYRSSDELVTRRILSRDAYERIKSQVNVRSSGKY